MVVYKPKGSTGAIQSPPVVNKGATITVMPPVSDAPKVGLGTGKVMTQIGGNTFNNPVTGKTQPKPNFQGLPTSGSTGSNAIGKVGKLPSAFPGGIPGTPGAKPAPAPGQGQDPFGGITDYANKEADAMYKRQEALLQQQRDQALADLQKAYADAVANGQISIRDAQAAFDAQKGQIDQQAYLDSQASALAATDRGIGNSQQMAGMIASDNAREMNLHNSNMTERDKRVADITDRINAITKQKDLDLANVNNQYNAGLVAARSGVDADRFGKLFDFNKDNYFMDKQQKFDLEKLSVQQKYTLEQMATAQGYDLAKMDKAQVYDLAKMAQQYGYDMGLQNDAQKHDYGMETGRRTWESSEAAKDRSWKDADREDTQSYEEYMWGKDAALQRALASMRASSGGGGSSSGGSSGTGGVNSVKSAYQEYNKSKTSTPTDAYYKSVTDLYNFPIGTSQEYIDNFNKKYTPAPMQNGLLRNNWERATAMFGRK